MILLLFLRMLFQVVYIVERSRLSGFEWRSIFDRPIQRNQVPGAHTFPNKETAIVKAGTVENGRHEDIDTG